MSRAVPILDSPRKTTAVGFSAPFAPEDRASGVFLHVTSLPSRFGIGDLGPSAFAWVDQLAGAGQSWWQVLPLGPTGHDHSPYQALSSFAANTLIVSPDRLLAEELLEEEDFGEFSFASNLVDFAKVVPFKERLLTRAWKKFCGGARSDLRPEFEQFLEEKRTWQEEVPLFMALRAEVPRTSFSAMADRSGPARTLQPGAGAARLRRGDGSLSIRPVHRAPAMAHTQSVRERARRAIAR